MPQSSQQQGTIVLRETEWHKPSWTKQLLSFFSPSAISSSIVALEVLSTTNKSDDVYLIGLTSDAKLQIWSKGRRTCVHVHNIGSGGGGDDGDNDGDDDDDDIDNRESPISCMYIIHVSMLLLFQQTRITTINTHSLSHVLFVHYTIYLSLSLNSHW